jgi:hypothetical protein
MAEFVNILDSPRVNPHDFADGSGKSPLLSAAPPSILAEWLPNCIAHFFLELAWTSPNLRAVSRSSILSPTP